MFDGSNQVCALDQMQWIDGYGDRFRTLVITLVRKMRPEMTQNKEERNRVKRP